MKNLKMIYSLLVVLAAGLFASCTTDPYTPAKAPAGPQVCFSNQNKSVFEISGTEDNTKEILLTRVVADAALDVYIIADAGENASLFTIPDKVTFAAGEKEAALAITVNSAGMAEDKEYAVSLLLADEKQGTPYGNSGFVANFKLFPWTLLETEEAEFGKFRGGDTLSTFFDIETATAEIDVKVYTHKSQADVYMVENPWAKMIVPTLGIESEEAIEDAKWKHVAANLVINCSNPSKCYIEKQSTGLTYASYGELMIASDYHPESNPTAVAGTFEEGVLTFPAEAILAGLTKFEGGTMFESNLNGAFRLVLPGCIAVDYAVAVDYLGMEVSPDMKSVVAKFDVSFGEDVEGLKYYFAEGNVLADPESAINALIDGTATDIREVQDFVKGSKTLALNTTIANGGLYTIVMAPVAADGSLVKKGVALDSFYYSGLGNLDSHPCEITATTFAYTDKFTPKEGEEHGNHNAIGFNIKGANLKKLYVGCWATEVLNNYLAKEGNTVETLMSEEGIESYTLEELTEVHSAEGKSDFIGGLSAESKYSIVFYAVNDYEESNVETIEYTTAAAPVYTGDFGVGKYTWKYSKSNKTYETILEVKSYQGSATRFLVSGLGYEDGSEWYATYDETAGTLTLDGKVRGREKEGNLFGVIFGNIDEETVYMYASVAVEGTAGYRNDPFVFTVDKDTKKLNGQQTVMTIYTQKSGKTSIYAQYDASTNTTITPYVETPGTDEGAGEESGSTENN